MISVLGFDIQLPSWLSFLSGNTGSFIGTIIVSAIIGLILYFLVFVIIGWFSRKSETEIDDVILGASRTPFMLLVILLSLDRSVLIWTNEIAIWADSLLKTLTALIATWWISRVFRDGIIYQLEEISQNSEAAWDDVLVPVVKSILPPIIWTVGIIVALEFWGLDLTGLYVALGGGAFILAFALQDILSNLFSGLVLLFDTPFQFGDVVKMEDGSIVVIQDIGLRVTHLYNIGDHSDIYIPNAVLGSTSIVNITRPTTDLVASFKVGIGYNSDTTKVYEILKEILYGHPDILGDIEKKTKPYKELNKNETRSPTEKFSTITPNKREVTLKRLEAEQEVNTILSIFEKKLEQFSKLAHNLETGGLSEIERDQLQEKFTEVISVAGYKTMPTPRRRFGYQMWKLETLEGEASLRVKINKWIEFWLADPDLVDEDKGDKGVLAKEWHNKLFRLEKRIEKLLQYVMNPAGHERRLDAYTNHTIDWINSNFKRTHVMWKDPDVRLVDLGASSLDFEVSFFVDNIKLEHYERAERIQDELRREIKRRLDDEKIELPFPQQDLWFRNALKIEKA